ncbi:unnamed protein product [Lampetra planeri]
MVAHLRPSAEVTSLANDPKIEPFWLEKLQISIQATTHEAALRQKKNRLVSSRGDAEANTGASARGITLQRPLCAVAIRNQQRGNNPTSAETKCGWRTAIDQGESGKDLMECGG